MHPGDATILPDAADIQERILRAVQAVMDRDDYLFRHDLNERSITHRFAVHLQREFPGWDVDCEYNRDHDVRKELDLPPKNDIASDDLDATTVFPDIIIHHRGTDENLAVIEVKKSTSTRNDEWDMAKLRAFRRQLEYRVAVFVRFPTGNGGGKVEVLWVEDGWKRHMARR
jgi:hypothetical protein